MIHPKHRVKKLKQKVGALSNGQKLVLFVAMFGLFGATALLIAQAATPTASFEAESSTVASNAVVVNDATASAGKAVQFNAPVVTPPPTGGGCPPYPAVPDASCTGVPAGTALTSVGNTVYTTSNGQVIDAQNINGPICVRHNNVTVKRTKTTGITPSNGSYGWCTGSSGQVTGLVIQDTEIDGQNSTSASSGLQNGYFTCTRCKIHNVPQGINAVSGNWTLEDSYIYDIFGYGEGHHCTNRRLSLQLCHNCHSLGYAQRCCF